MGVSTLQESVLVMTNWCHFDPSQIPSSMMASFPCPECGVAVVAGWPHPVDFDDIIEYDHEVVQWIEGRKDDSDS